MVLSLPLVSLNYNKLPGLYHEAKLCVQRILFCYIFYKTLHIQQYLFTIDMIFCKSFDITDNSVLGKDHILYPFPPKLRILCAKFG